MPVFADHYRNSRQTRDSPSSSPSINQSSVALTNTNTVLLAGGAYASSRPRLYPRDNNRNPKSPHLSNTTSPLISALQNPSDLFTRSIPFPTFLSSSSPSSGAPGSLGSASGGVGLSGSPPPSAPASYSSGAGFSAPRQVRGYPGFEEQYSAPNSSTGHYYPSQRYQHGSLVIANGQTNGGATAHLNAGEHYASEFQTLDELGFVGGTARVASGTSGGDNVVCLGWDGGVDVWRVGRGTVDLVGRLEGLKGGVKSAKILPNPPLNDPLAAHRPLVCLIIHSQITGIAGADAENGPPILLENDSPYSTSPPSRPETSNSQRQSHQSSDPSDWQTTVEVWSLTSKTRLATLFTSPVIPTADVGFGNHAQPPVWGGLRTQVTANKIVVTMGASGELYLFGIDPGLNSLSKPQKAQWKCFEKIWTSVQFPIGAGYANDNGVNGNGDGRMGNNYGLPTIGTPVFALSDRWLAYCPASTGCFSAGGEVGVPVISPSVSSQTPPNQPPISAAVSLEDEALLNRMAREVTQEVIRGTKWAVDAGYKKFQSYWNGGTRNDPSPPQGYDPGHVGTNGYPHQNGTITHLQTPAHSSQPSGLGQQLRQVQMGSSPLQFQQYNFTQSSHEPRLVSLIDMEKLPLTNHQNNGLPMATFLPPAGVSYLSFAPGGLTLLTASSKGDLLDVWDLMKVVHQPPGSGTKGHQRASSMPIVLDHSMADSDSLGRHIRQIARFTRMTVATIVDVDWSSPRGEKIAVVTERGTAHFYELPFGALMWPPPRPAPPSSTAINNSQTTAAGAAVTNAVNFINNSTQPLLAAARRRRSRSSSVGSPNGGMFHSPSGRRPTNLGAPGTSPNDTPTGGNKIPLPRSITGVAPGCVKFLTAKERGHVAVLGGGLLRIYELRPGGSGKKGSKTGGVASGKWWEYDLPQLPTATEAANTADLAGDKAGGFWGVRAKIAEDEAEADNSYWKTPLAYAEIETNSAVVAWHQERRVKMFVYEGPKKSPQHRVPTPEIKVEHSYMLSPSPIDWNPMEDVPPVRAETPTISGKKKQKKSKLSSPIPSMSPQTAPVSEMQLVPVEPVVEEKWVFGKPMECERIYMSDANGHGDVEFAGDGELGLEVAMADGLGLEEIRAARPRGRKGGEGFFEDEAEVLEYIG